ncbi:MAG: hypothetical protein ACOVS5_17865 [Oligoflexus sp.]
MASGKATMQKLLDERQRLAYQMEAIKNQIAGIDRAISILQGSDQGSEETAPPTKAPRRQSNLKSIVIDILRAADPRGLSALEVVEAAKSDGVTLDRGSVSSLLSRLKKDELCDYNRLTGQYSIVSPTANSNLSRTLDAVRDLA